GFRLHAPPVIRLVAHSGRTEREGRADARGGRAAEARGRTCKQALLGLELGRQPFHDAPPDYPRSRIVPVPSPPPQHIVTSARSVSERSSSCSAVVINRALVAPTGWPSAMAPPLMLTRAMSGFNSRSHASRPEATASLIPV